MAARSRSMAVAVARVDRDDRLRAPGPRTRRGPRPPRPRAGRVSMSVRSSLRARVRLEAVGDDVARPRDGDAAHACHLAPVGWPAPPRPRRPDVATSRATCSGVRAPAAWRHAVHAPAASAASMSVDAPATPAAREQDGRPGRIAREDGHRQAARPWATVGAQRGGDGRRVLGARPGQHVAVHDDPGRADGLAAAIGCLQADRAIGAHAADVGAQVLLGTPPAPCRRRAACTGCSGRPRRRGCRGSRSAGAGSWSRCRTARCTRRRSGARCAGARRPAGVRRPSCVSSMMRTTSRGRCPAGRGCRRAAPGRCARTARTWRSGTGRPDRRRADSSRRSAYCSAAPQWTW